jgi:Ca-activated chloride channel family protein
LEASSLGDDLWTSSSRGLRLAATAAYFADALRQGDDRRTRLPGSLPLSELGVRADELASGTADRAVRGLAEAIETATGLMR